MIFDKDQTEMMDVFQELDIHSKITLDQSSEEKRAVVKKIMNDSTTEIMISLSRIMKLVLMNHID